MMEPQDKFDAILRSAVILAYARHGDWEKVGALVTELGEIHNGPGIQLLICGLADTIVIYQGGHSAPGEMIAPIWVDGDGNASDADGVQRAEILWAGRFIAARAAMDDDACAALVNSCADQPDRYAQNVLGLVEVAAYTLNEMGAPT